MTGLVPSNHRLFEHALAAGLEPIKAIDPAPITSLWDAWRCPAALLPFLAWALSVDIWDDGWDEIRQRRAIAESPDYHRRKGTAQAVQDAATYTGRETTMLEWHEFVPERRRGTFVVIAHLAPDEPAMPPAEATLLTRLIRAAKPKSRSFTLTASHVELLTAPVGVGIMAGSGAVLMVPPDDLHIDFNPHVWMQPGSGAPLEVQ